MPAGATAANDSRAADCEWPPAKTLSQAHNVLRKFTRSCFCRLVKPMLKRWS